MRRLVRPICIIFLTALISGCALPVGVQVASLALGGMSYMTTNKSLTDHGLSFVAQQDCAMHRIVTGGLMCRKYENFATLMALKNAPENGQRKYGVQVARQGEIGDILNLAPVSLAKAVVEPQNMMIPVTELRDAAVTAVEDLEKFETAAGRPAKSSEKIPALINPNALPESASVLKIWESGANIPSTPSNSKLSSARKAKTRPSPIVPGQPQARLNLRNLPEGPGLMAMLGGKIMPVKRAVPQIAARPSKEIAVVVPAVPPVVPAFDPAFDPVATVNQTPPDMPDTAEPNSAEIEIDIEIDNPRISPTETPAISSAKPIAPEFRDAVEDEPAVKPARRDIAVNVKVEDEVSQISVEPVELVNFPPASRGAKRRPEGSVAIWRDDQEVGLWLGEFAARSSSHRRAPPGSPPGLLARSPP